MFRYMHACTCMHTHTHAHTHTHIDFDCTLEPFLRNHSCEKEPLFWAHVFKVFPSYLLSVIEPFIKECRKKRSWKKVLEKVHSKKTVLGKISVEKLSHTHMCRMGERVLLLLAVIVLSYQFSRQHVYLSFGLKSVQWIKREREFTVWEREMFFCCWHFSKDMLTAYVIKDHPSLNTLF